MLHSIKTTCPVFSGFYDSLPNAIIEDAEECVIDENPDCDIDFKYEDCRLDIASQYTSRIEHLLKRDFHIFTKIIFNGLWSPREYNFRTDEIDCLIKIHQSSIDRIKTYLTNNLSEWSAYLEDNFKSRSGFASFYSYDPDWHLENITEEIVFKHALTFMILNEDNEAEQWICDEIRGNVSLNYTIAD